MSKNSEYKNWVEFLNQCGQVSDENKIPKGRLELRKNLFKWFNLKGSETLVDIGTGTGFLSFKAFEKLKENGKIIATDFTKECIDFCQKRKEAENLGDNFVIIEDDITNSKIEDATADIASTRSVIMHILDKEKALSEIYRILKPKGRYIAFETIYFLKHKRYSDDVNPKKIHEFKKFKEIEEKIGNDARNPLTNATVKDYKKWLKKCGFTNIKIYKRKHFVVEYYTKESIEDFFTVPRLVYIKSLKDQFLEYISEEEYNQYLEEIKENLNNKHGLFMNSAFYITAHKNPSFLTRLKSWFIINPADNIRFFIKNLLLNSLYYFLLFLIKLDNAYIDYKKQSKKM